MKYRHISNTIATIAMKTKCLEKEKQFL